MKKKLLIGTNTKMYKDIRETVIYLQRLRALTNDLREELDIFVIPSYTALESARRVVSSQEILLGAQNIGWEDQGQYTGEISPLMLKEIGVDLVMIGHSERRTVFRETDEEVNKKVKSSLFHGFKTLLCIGETNDDKNKGISDEILSIQIKKALHGIDADKLDNLMIAYEPVWAIGEEGIPASPDYAQDKQKIIKNILSDLYDNSSTSVPILYGGSVNLENAKDLIMQEDVDGLFIGRSAWDADKFNQLIREVLPVALQKG